MTHHHGNLRRMVSGGSLSVVILAAFLALVSPAWAQNPDDWSYQRPVSIFNNGAELTDYQVKIVLDAGNFDFTPGPARRRGPPLHRPGRRRLLPLLDRDLGSGRRSSAVVWVRLPDLPAGDPTVIAMLTGNPAATPRSDGAATFLFYSGFEELAGPVGMNAPTPLVTPTYDGSGQVVHPDVVHVPGGWNGYEYWMGMTPYPNSNDNYENPSIIASNDNATWVVPSGRDEPALPRAATATTTTSTCCWWAARWSCTSTRPTTTATPTSSRLASTDGVNWGPAQTVITMPNYVMSPAVIHDGGVYTMWYVRSAGGCSAAAQDFYLRTSVDGITWGPEQAADHGPSRPRALASGRAEGRRPVHHAVHLLPGRLLLRQHPALLRREHRRRDLDRRSRPGARADDLGLGQRQHLPRLLHLRRHLAAGLVLGHVRRAASGAWATPRATWTTSSSPRPTPGPNSYGNVAATTDHPRTGTHGLREIGGSTYPQVFGALDGGGRVRQRLVLGGDEHAPPTSWPCCRLWDSTTRLPVPLHRHGHLDRHLHQPTTAGTTRASATRRPPSCARRPAGGTCPSPWARPPAS